MRRALPPTGFGPNTVRRAGLSPLLRPPCHRARGVGAFHSKSPNASEAVAPVAKTANTPAGTIAAKPAPPPARNRITIADIAARRAKAGRLIAGTAAASDTSMFKGPSAGKLPALRFDHHLSPESASRVPCMLKQAARHLKKPNLISLGGGLPCADNFPFNSLSLNISPPPSFPELSSGVTLPIEKYSATRSPTTSEYDLSIALNYGQANGSAQLNRFCAEHTELAHAPLYSDWASCLTVGSTGALEQLLRMFCDKERGDTVLTEEYSFSTAVETAMPLGIKVAGVEMDEEGMIPSALDRLLKEWKGERRPHVLYTVPSGQNPTGATMGVQRRREIYEVARRWDLMILEDEPYYFLQMPVRGTPAQETVEGFLDGLIPSLLSMDADGRVVRMDSFSKVVVPGSRVGWITASEQIVERYIRHAEVCNQGPSGFSQVILHKLLDESWGHEGYFRWLMHLRGEYTRRRNVLMEACDEFLPRGVVTWDVPRAGMFHWIKVDHTRHPDFPTKSILEIEEDIFNRCIEKGVLVGRGSWFRAEHEKPPRDMFFRTTFAAATPENMKEAIKRLGGAIREAYRAG
ncbi:hypothetical protein OQA88_3780 [Cercophora sp. LCS_1]